MHYLIGLIATVIVFFYVVVPALAILFVCLTSTACRA